MANIAKMKAEIKKLTNVDTFYEDARKIVGYYDNVHIEDRDIKCLQRIADARYAELTRKRYCCTITISEIEAAQINKHLHEEPSCADDCLGEDIAITHTATFDNGITVDIKCCGVQYNEDEESNTAWTEAVLFKDGHEINCSEPSDEYLGEWILEYNNDEYVVLVEVEKETIISKNNCEINKTRISDLWNKILDMLPHEPRSYDTADDPGFWTNGEEILCPSECEMNVVYVFLNDIFSEFGSYTLITGYYDPFEDEKQGEQDNCTGFYYVRLE